MPHFDFENFLMVGSRFPVNAVLSGAEGALLQPFLQRGFEIGACKSSCLAEKSRLDQSAAEKSGGGGQAGVEINGPGDGFVGVSEESFFFAATGFFFAGTEPQMSAQIASAARRHK